jgi:hypothetical protein
MVANSPRYLFFISPKTPLSHVSKVSSKQLRHDSTVLSTPHGQSSAVSLTPLSRQNSVCWQFRSVVDTAWKINIYVLDTAQLSHCIHVQVSMYLHTSMFDRVSKFKWPFTVWTCMSLCIDVKSTWSCVHMHMHAHQEPANFFPLSLLILRWPTTPPRARPVADFGEKTALCRCPLPLPDLVDCPTLLARSWRAWRRNRSIPIVLSSSYP